MEDWQQNHSDGIIMLSSSCFPPILHRQNTHVIHIYVNQTQGSTYFPNKKLGKEGLSGFTFHYIPVILLIYDKMTSETQVFLFVVVEEF